MWTQRFMALQAAGNHLGSLRKWTKPASSGGQRQEDLNKGRQSLGDNMTFVVKPHSLEL